MLTALKLFQKFERSRLYTTFVKDILVKTNCKPKLVQGFYRITT